MNRRLHALLLSSALLATAAVGSGTAAAAPTGELPDAGDPVASAPLAVTAPVTPELTEIPLGSTQAPAAEATVQQGTTQAVPEQEAAPVLAVQETTQEPFSALGVTWQDDPEVTDVRVKVRVQSEDGAWGEWSELQQDAAQVQGPDAVDDRGGTEPLWTGPSVAVEAEVLATGAQPQDVRLVLVDPGQTTLAAQAPASALSSAATRSSATSASTTSSGLSSSTVSSAAPATAMPHVYTRAQWGADEKLRKSSPDYAAATVAATLHHTADSNAYTAAEVPALMRSIYAYHTRSRGWSDIGYNVIIDKFGRLWEGRFGGLGAPVIGAHAGGFNTGTFGVSMLGNYDVAQVPDAVVEAAAGIIAWKFALSGIDPNSQVTLRSAGGGTARYPAGRNVTLPAIFGHKDVGQTACPGTYGYAKLPALRSRVAAKMPSGPVNDVTPSGLSALRASGGQTTVFVRGTDSGVWFRTSTGSGWNDWRPVPGGITTGAPAAVSWNGRRVDLVVRGTDGGYWHTFSNLDSAGRPTGWPGWVQMGGSFSSAPAVGSVGENRLAIAGRGLDGSLYQSNWAGTRWTGWTGVGGAVVSAPTVEADLSAGGPRYRVSAVGIDNRLWLIPTGASAAQPTGPWTGGRDYSSHGPQAVSNSASTWSQRATTTGGADHSVVMVDPGSTWASGLGGRVTSTAAIVREQNGSVTIYARGGDNAIWSVNWHGTSKGWRSLGGTAW